MRVVYCGVNNNLLIIIKSNHEGQVVVSDAVPDVERAIHWCVESVECVEAGPESVSEVGHALGAIAHQAPAALGEVDHDVVEEVIIVHGFVALEETNLLRLRDHTEVLPAAKAECVILSKSMESLILNGLLEGSELVAALGDDSTVVLNTVHDVTEPVELSDHFRRQHDALVLIDDYGRAHCLLDHHTVMLACEENIQLVELLGEFIEGLGQGGEDVVGGRSPVVVLRGKSMVLCRVVQRVRDEVVLNGTYRFVRIMTTYQ